MIHIVSDTSTLYSTTQAREAGFAVSGKVNQNIFPAAAGEERVRSGHSVPGQPG